MKLENRMLFAGTLLSTLLMPSLFGSTRPPETEGSLKPVIIQNKTGREIYIRTKSLSREGLQKGTFEAEKTAVNRLAPNAEVKVMRSRFGQGFSISGWLGEPDKPGSVRIFGLRGEAAFFSGLNRMEIQAGKTANEFRRISEYDCTGLDCPICLEKVQSTDMVSITECNHKFHKHCLDPLIEKINRGETANACPICRQPLKRVLVAPAHYRDIVDIHDGKIISHKIEPITTSESVTY